MLSLLRGHSKAVASGQVTRTAHARKAPIAQLWQLRWDRDLDTALHDASVTSRTPCACEAMEVTAQSHGLDKQAWWKMGHMGE